MANPFSKFIGPDGTEYEVKDAKARAALKTRPIALAADGWSGEYPYTQTVGVEGLTATDSLHVLGLYIPDGATADQVKEWKKAASCLMSSVGGVADGAATFKADKKPSSDFTVVVNGGC